MEEKQKREKRGERERKETGRREREKRKRQREERERGQDEIKASGTRERIGNFFFPPKWDVFPFCWF